MRQVLFPVLSASDPTAEGVVATWFVTDGERVEEGDLLVEVQVDKVSSEVYSPADGVVHVVVGENAVVSQGTVVATVT